MERETVPTEETPPSGSGPQPGVRRVEIGFVAGDLTIRESDEPYVRVDGVRWDEDATGAAPAAVGGEPLRITRLPDNAELYIPHAVAVSVREVAGDLRAADLAGALAVGRIGGKAELTGVSAADLDHVASDLRATHGGTLRVREVGGDAGLDGMYVAPALGRIGGDLEARGLPGLEVDTVGGDVQVQECTEDVRIRGSVGGDVTADGYAGTLRIGSVGHGLRARLGQSVVVEGSVGGDCEVSEVAGAVDLRGSVGGHLRASLVGGLSIAGAVGRDAELATIAHGVHLRTVGGKLDAEELAGALSAGKVGGDVRLRTCLDAIRLGMVGGDVTIQRATGGVALAWVGGSVVLETPLAAGAEYQVRAAGDVRLRVRGEINARFVAQTLGGEIRTRLPLTVERGRRRNLVGALGRGDATVTLHSNGGDITIAAYDEEDMMSDEFVGAGAGTGPNDQGTNPRTWEGSFGGHKFRVRWDPGAQGAGAPEDPDGVGGPRRGFGFEWEHTPERDRQAAEEFEQRMNELRDKAERMARRAAEQAQRYAERAARRARETDWESVGREVRSAIERTMTELEEAVGQIRREFDTRRGSGAPGNGSGAGPRPNTGAQRVRIEHDEEGDTFASGYGYGSPSTPGAGPSAGPAAGPTLDAESRRRAILEELRAGTISLDEAERRLGDLR